jgi:alkanesulfonate monooxygenase
VGRAAGRTAEQIESVRQAAKEAGRTDTPKIQVAFRPIIAPTEAQAWEKAHDIVARIEARVQASGGALTRRRPIKNPENTGSQRLIAIAEPKASGSTGRCGPGPPPSPAARATPTRWSARPRPSRRRSSTTSTSASTSSRCAATTCSQDAIDVGQQVIPIVREEVAKRDHAAAAAVAGR